MIALDTTRYKASRVSVIGDRYSRLTVLAEASNRGGSLRRVLAVCDCGTEKLFILHCLKSGKTTSCGCYSSEQQATRMRKHGLSRTGVYHSWHDMMKRCYNPQRTSWKNYGGRGITVCDEWKDSVEVFCEWALAHGWEQGLELDRIDNDGNYEPGNCRFVTSAENNRNRKRLKAEVGGMQ